MTNRQANNIFKIVLSVLPLGVAGQHVGLSVGLLLLLVFEINSTERLHNFKKSLSLPIFIQFFILWSLIVIPILVSTLISNRLKDANGFFWGYFLCSTIPFGACTLAVCRTNLKLKKVAALIVSILALIAVSQSLIGWKLEGSSIVDSIRRAQGFYSHPLTLAYSALVFVPIVVCYWASHLNQRISWVLFLGLWILIASSQSVTVLTLALLLTIGACIYFPVRKNKIILILFAAIVGGLVLFAPNPIGEKVRIVMSGERGDRETGYQDDRIAFWHAHWEMFKDAPLLGHGTGLTKLEREPYYNKIGLSHIERMYEAHNMFLQMAVEGGFIAPLALVALLIWIAKIASNARDLPDWERISYILSPLIFGLGGLTQNAFQDSEVRFALLVFIGMLLYRTIITNHQVLK